MASMATETKSPTWTSISPLSFLNSSIGTYASDLRPALTTTKLCSIRTTSEVITSPVRISERCSDSSNIEAKDSMDSDIRFPCTSHRFPDAKAKSLQRGCCYDWDGGFCGLGPRVKLTNHTAWALARERGGVGLSTSFSGLQKRLAFAYP